MIPRDFAAFAFSQVVFAFALGGVIYFSRRQFWSKSYIHTAAAFVLGAALSAILQILTRLAL